MLAYNVSRNLDQHKFPKMYEMAKELIEYRAGEKNKELVLDNLNLIAQLLILNKKGGDSSAESETK
jgi:non-homologous end joining protein Ku